MPFQVGGVAVHDDGQHSGSAKRDIAEGVAGLDAGGDLVVPGESIYLTRDVFGDIRISERTSGENVFYFNRIGLNDFAPHLMTGGSYRALQHAGMKDVANGIAGLDANVHVDPILLPSCLEEYSNHLGATDNFTETVVTGVGTATSDAANHEMDLTSSSGNPGSAVYKSKKGWTLGPDPLVFNAIIDNINYGAAGARIMKIGFANLWTSLDQDGDITISYHSAVGSEARTCNGVSCSRTEISNLVSGDLVTIVATNAKVVFFLNGVVLATHTNYIPTVAMEIGAYVGGIGVDVTTGISISVDVMGVKRYV